MGRLLFDRDGLRKALNHSSQSHRFRDVYGEPTGKPGLLLVHDNGVYLMSNGVVKADESPPVVYARGLNPNKIDVDAGEVYERARDAVGGDDFAEFFAASDWRWAIREAPEAWSTVAVTVTASSITIEAVDESSPDDLLDRFATVAGEAK